jgi:putative hydrolase of the HAD superfamily
VNPGSTSQIKAITFDVGGTLIEPWPSVGHIYAQVASRFDLKEISATILNQRFKQAWSSGPAFDYSLSAWETLVRKTFDGIVEPAACASFFPDLYNRFAEPDAWRVFDDVRPTLEKLAAMKFRLGIISNWDDRLPDLLKQLKLCDYFEVVVISCEAGVTKPSPGIFQKAALGLGLSPTSILHVGDDLETDCRGATAAGFKALFLRRSSAEAELDQLHSLFELPQRLSELDKTR